MCKAIFGVRTAIFALLVDQSVALGLAVVQRLAPHDDDGPAFA